MDLLNKVKSFFNQNVGKRRRRRTRRSKMTKRTKRSMPKTRRRRGSRRR